MFEILLIISSLKSSKKPHILMYVSQKSLFYRTVFELINDSELLAGSRGNTTLLLNLFCACDKKRPKFCEIT